jgi:hypothetical protein
LPWRHRRLRDDFKELALELAIEQKCKVSFPDYPAWHSADDHTIGLVLFETLPEINSPLSEVNNPAKQSRAKAGAVKKINRPTVTCGYHPKLAHLGKEARALAEEMCEPHWHKHTIKLGVITDDRKSPPTDITWDHRYKNEFSRSFAAKHERSAAVEWTIDALLKGHTVFRGMGGWHLWDHIQA